VLEEADRKMDAGKYVENEEILTALDRWEADEE
jgi:hypothetical protein